MKKYHVYLKIGNDQCLTYALSSNLAPKVHQNLQRKFIAKNKQKICNWIVDNLS